MTAFQSFLSSPNTKRVLARKPGDAGFSLIELVVVVAVLAILAAIAIPAFTSINDEARVAGAKSTLANLTKECAVKLVGTGAKTYTMPTLSGYTISAKAGTAGTCGNSDVYAATPQSGIILPTFELDTTDGDKDCTPNANAGTNKSLGCTSNKW